MQLVSLGHLVFPELPVRKGIGDTQVRKVIKDCKAREVKLVALVLLVSLECPVHQEKMDYTVTKDQWARLVLQVRKVFLDPEALMACPEAPVNQV